MVELTEQQLHALDERGPPLQIVDPRNKTAYVLIRLDTYARIEALLPEEVRATAELVERIMAEDDANDPHLEEYQRLYGGKP